jgi:hypothetical protein
LGLIEVDRTFPRYYLPGDNLKKVFLVDNLMLLMVIMQYVYFFVVVVVVIVV